MSKPQKTAADYMVIAISPVLIMGLVGSLCFFLTEVFYRGQMQGSVRWVLFWYVLAIVLITRIGIEKSPQAAGGYGIGLALATWIFLIRTQPAYWLGIVLLAIVWFCAHKLVWDCTLIDEDLDSSGQGLLEGAPANGRDGALRRPGRRRAASLPVKTKKKAAPQGSPSPGRWVIYFSVAALPLFGIGQMLLPAGNAGSRRTGVVLLMIYLGAALGLLVTTSFLGLRRYLRQRYLKMPPSIALGWLRFGVFVAAVVLAVSLFLPRPGANQAWSWLRYQIDYQLRQASKYASRETAPGEGEGRAGNSDAGKDQGQKGNAGEHKVQTQSGEPQPGSRGQPGQMGNPQGAGAFQYLRLGFYLVAAIIAVIWLFRMRYFLLEMWRSLLAALAEFWRKLMSFGEIGKPSKRVETDEVRPRYRTFARYKNPFFADKGDAWPPEQILIYTYEALQVWAKEEGIEPLPTQTAREFCRELGGQRPEISSSLEELAHLYAHAAYARRLPPGSDLEPVKELWRQMLVPRAQAVPTTR